MPKTRIFVFAVIGFVFLSCSNKSKDVNDSNIDNPVDSVYSYPQFVYTFDSLKVAFDSVKWEESLDFIMTGDGDSLFTDTFLLKNNYKLILFSAPDGLYDEDKISYGHYARLVGENIDTILAQASTSQLKYVLRYDSIDFDDHFVIEYSGGGNYALYCDLYEKSTGRLIINGLTGSSYDLENQMMIVYPNEENEDILLFDIAKNKRYPLVEPFEDPCFGPYGRWTAYRIEKVTPSTVYISYDWCDEPVTIKIKR